MQPLCWGHLRADWADRMLQTDFLRPDAMPIRLEQTLFLLMWTTNCFSATPTRILSVESCLAPVSLLINHRQRLAALRVVCSPPSVNPATARLHPSFPLLSAHGAPDSSRALTWGLSSVYLPLHWKTPRPVPPMRNHLPVDAVAHRTILFTLGLFRMPMINSHLMCPTPRPPAPVLDGQYLLRPEEEGKRETPRGVGLPFPDPGVLPTPSRTAPKAFHGLGQVRCRENPPDEGRKKLSGRPPDLEVPRRRHLLPPLRLGT